MALACNQDTASNLPDRFSLARSLTHRSISAHSVLAFFEQYATANDRAQFKLAGLVCTRLSEMCIPIDVTPMLAVLQADVLKRVDQPKQPMRHNNILAEA